MSVAIHKGNHFAFIPTCTIDVFQSFALARCVCEGVVVEAFESISDAAATGRQVERGPWSNSATESIPH